MKNYFYSLCAATLLIAAPAAAQDAPPEQPVIDRIVLKKKKKPVAEVPAKPVDAPVVDRIVLKKKKKPIAFLEEEEKGEVAATFPAECPAPPAVPVADCFDSAPAPQLIIETIEVAGLGREGGALFLGYTAGSKNRVQLGYEYWVSTMVGFSVQASYWMMHETKTLKLSSGQRRVDALAYTVTPEASFYLGTARGRDLRLYLETGAGMNVSKEERKNFSIGNSVSGWQAFTGPGIQWHAAPPFSIRLGERLVLESSRVPVPSYGLSMATQVVASWWFN